MSALVVPQTRRTTIGDCVFPVAGTRVLSGTRFHPLLLTRLL